MTLLIRSPEENDYAAIASWIPDAVACARWAGPRMPFPFAVRDLPELLRMPEGRSRVLGQADRQPALGFGQYWVNRPGEVHLGRIIVAPEERGRGLGKQLCRLLMKEAVLQTGAEALTLRVYRDNPAAQAVYAGLGFQPLEAESDNELLFMRVPARTAVCSD
jgi:RimJ/RimL family protein N-acetyltransferase